ncbi:replication initiator protein [Microviridae sp.]|nr:replication initiator protein [Microviridae sp.]
MQCTSPIRGYRGLEGGIKFAVKDTYRDQPITVRCGQCMGCRLHRSFMWGVRIKHESTLYDQNIFTTQTYSDENLPYGGTLVKKHMQDFMKRLKEKHAQKIRQYYCGEYGDQTDRAHYHAVLFNYRPNDGELHKIINGIKYYRSDKLDALWGHGTVLYSDVTLQSACYVAGYVRKKVNGKLAEEKYTWIDPDTGEIIDRVAPFGQPSLNPGIGYEWIKKWLYDVYPRDQIIMDGKAIRPPRYYDQCLEKLDPNLWKEVRAKRAKQNLQQWEILEHTDIIHPTETRKVLKKKDPNAYYGTGRQMFCKNKITISKDQKRDETK